MKKTAIFSAHEISAILLDEAIRRLGWRGPIALQANAWDIHDDAERNTISVTLSDE